MPKRQKGVVILVFAWLILLTGTVFPQPMPQYSPQYSIADGDEFMIPGAVLLWMQGCTPDTGPEGTGPPIEQAPGIVTSWQYYFCGGSLVLCWMDWIWTSQGWVAFSSPQWETILAT